MRFFELRSQNEIVRLVQNDMMQVIYNNDKLMLLHNNLI